MEDGFWLGGSIKAMSDASAPVAASLSAPRGPPPPPPLDLSGRGPYIPLPPAAYTMTLSAADASGAVAAVPIEAYVTLPDGSDVAQRPFACPLVLLINGFQSRAHMYAPYAQRLVSWGARGARAAHVAALPSP